MPIDKRKAKGSLLEKLENKEKPKEETGNFKVSFQHYDSSQKFGSSFLDWQSIGLLSHTLEVLKGYCCRPLMEQVDGNKFTIYGNFPGPEYNEYRYPKTVPQDANWARIHITGKAVLAGHVVKDTFYVVFLDRSHKFYKSKYDRPKKDGGI